MELVVRNWPPDGEALALDHERFIYGGKFNTARTAKAVARADGEIVAAVAFNEDRTDDDTLRFRYVSVRVDRRAEGIGPRVLAFAARRAREHGYERVDIAVNNPYAFEAAYRAGFVFTGEETGMAELRCRYLGDGDGDGDGKADGERYADGLARLRERDLPTDQQAFLARTDDVPPEPVTE